MGFLAPALLAGLAALAVPIIVHLLMRERHTVVEFPSLMFLRKIPQQTTSRKRLRHPWLLLLRCLALALLAFAFARPFLKGRTALVTPTRGAREVVLLVDRSYSMGYGDRWQRAQAAARDVIARLDGDDRLTLVFFDAAAVPAAEPTGDRAVLTALVDRAVPGGGQTRFTPALKLAQGLLEDSDRVRREVVLVTDFQRSGWDGAADVVLPAGTELTRVDLSSSVTTNVAVAGVELAREVRDGRDVVTVMARLRNRGEAPVAARPLSLELNGRVLQTKPVELPASGTASVRFDAVPLPPGEARGIVRLADGDALQADDVFHFVVARAQTRAVLVVEPAGAGPNTSLYLTRALALARDPGYEVTVRSLDRLRAPDLDGKTLVVLNDVAPPSGENGRRLAEWVRAGGGVLVAMGERSARAAWDGPLAELAPLGVGSVTDRRTGTGSALAYVDRTHPVFSPFRATRGGDFASTRVLRYRTLRAEPPLRVLARFDDGGVALAEVPAGEGRVVVWTAGLDNAWSDLPVQPVFLPLVHELARHTAGAPPALPWLTVGTRVDVAAYAAALQAGAAPARATTAAPSEWLASAPSGARERLEAAAPVLEVAEPGFYEVRAVTDGGSAPRPLAVNLDPAEGDLAAMDPQELAVAVTAGAADGSARSRLLTAGEQEDRQALWWWLLLLTLLVLGGEQVYANRVSRKTR